VTYLQAIIIGLIQGITELFPISSLGHSVLLPSLFGWHSIVAAQTSTESFFLAFLVGLHCATAIAPIIFFRRKWASIIRGFFHTLKTRQAKTSDERLAWLIIFATIPVGLIGLIFEHELRVVFAKPLYAAIFLTINGLILFAGEHFRKRAQSRKATTKLATLPYKDAVSIGAAQSLALFAGISRSGITMVAGLVRGLDYEDAANFSFLLATPVILLAGIYKLPDLLGPNGAGIRGQVIAGSLVAGVAAYIAVKFLTKYFQTKTLRPFAIYSLVVGLLMIIRFA
jgi:undecaprenyl-diphosphatase